MRDLRLVWMNCKRYNARTSAIWHTADMLQLTSERLFHAWVLAFLPPADYRPERSANAPGKTSLLFNYKVCGNRKRLGPAARPWENSCRVSGESSSDSSDDDMLLCDHCDAQYRFSCLEPPLEAMPDHAWLCPVCEAEPFKMQSAAVEEKAAAKSDEAMLPHKKVRVHQFLVKWAGRSYGECSWEKYEDVEDDAKVEEFCRAHGIHISKPVAPGETKTEAVVTFEQMQSEFRSGFLYIVGTRSFRDPFQVPTLKAAPRIPTERLTDRVPMPLLDPHWVVSHDQPTPLAKEAAGLLRSYENPDAETPHANTRAQVYAQIRLAHYLAHMPPVTGNTRGV